MFSNPKMCMLTGGQTPCEVKEGGARSHGRPSLENRRDGFWIPETVKEPITLRFSGDRLGVGVLTAVKLKSHKGSA